ncbi:MAG: glycerophosphodiester phosphodiesterase [Proteobacteria bacterium]|nr:glycerophosphodiester phosphodiesterase [Pseudomonadota bacterium]
MPQQVRARWARPAERPLVLGHRGASARVTENTLDAFLAARDAGADGVELDARLCASGQVVVFHDDDLARLAGRGERIDRLSLEQLGRVRLDGDRRIPTLDDVFALVSAEDWIINVELKTSSFRSAALIDGVLGCIERHRMADRVLVSSFDPLAIARVRRRARRLLTGLLFHGGQPLPFRRALCAPLVRPHAVHPQHKLVTRTSLAAWRERGYAVNTWTVDGPDRQREVAQLGVDAIVTNDPAACLTAIGVAR